MNRYDGTINDHGTSIILIKIRHLKCSDFIKRICELMTCIKTFWIPSASISTQISDRKSIPSRNSAMTCPCSTPIFFFVALAVILSMSMAEQVAPQAVESQLCTETEISLLQQSRHSAAETPPMMMMLGVGGFSSKSDVCSLRGDVHITDLKGEKNTELANGLQEALVVYGLQGQTAFQVGELKVEVKLKDPRAVIGQVLVTSGDLSYSFEPGNSTWTKAGVLSKLGRNPALIMHRYALIPQNVVTTKCNVGSQGGPFSGLICGKQFVEKCETCQPRPNSEFKTLRKLQQRQAGFYREWEDPAGHQRG